MKLQEIRQTSKTKLLILFFTTFLLCTMQSCAQKEAKKTTDSTKIDYSNVDYSARSNIIKNPEQLTGDEKAIFYHPFFLKLTHEEAKNLKPLEIKEEFEKLGITLKDDKRFINAFNFFDTDVIFHKKSCENWHFHFKDLAPQSKN